MFGQLIDRNGMIERAARAIVKLGWSSLTGSEEDAMANDDYFYAVMQRVNEMKGYEAFSIPGSSQSTSSVFSRSAAIELEIEYQHAVEEESRIKEKLEQLRDPLRSWLTKDYKDGQLSLEEQSLQVGNGMLERAAERRRSLERRIVSAIGNIPAWSSAAQESNSPAIPRVTNLVLLIDDQVYTMVPVISDYPVGIITPRGQFAVAAPLVYVPGYNSSWLNLLDEFTALLEDPSSSEAAFQSFFERNPDALLGIDYQQVIAHPVLVREQDGPLVPDFFLQPLDRDLCDILELKLPSEPLLVGPKDRRRMSASFSEAVAQLREYGAYFDEGRHRERIRATYGVTAYKPRLCVVIGRTPDHVAAEEYRRIMAGQTAVNVLTYDDLLLRMQRLCALNRFRL